MLQGLVGVTGGGGVSGVVVVRRGLTGQLRGVALLSLATGRDCTTACLCPSGGSDNVDHERG
jgi:hypothetical protein